MSVNFVAEIKSSFDWLKDNLEIQIIDPDGWDRKNLEQSMFELITEYEFYQRVGKSTTLVPFHNPYVGITTSACSYEVDIDNEKD